MREAIRALGRINRKAAVVFLILAALLPSASAVHAEALYRINAEAGVATDSDSETKYYFGIGPEVMDSKKKQDMAAAATAGFYTFTGKGDNEETLGYLRLRGNYKFNETVTAAARLAFFDGSGWAQVMPGATVTLRPVAKSNIELFYDREIIDTIRAVEARDYVDTAGISADYEVIKNLTVVGAYYHQFFRDSNSRDGYLGKLVYAFGESGFSVSAYYKFAATDFKSELYFSPEEEQDLLFAGQFRTPVFGDKYIFRLKGGLGYQWIDNFGGTRSSKLLTLAEAGLKGWYSDHFGVDGALGFSNNAGYGNYSRFYAQLVLIYAF